ncbi:MAG TPA: SIS domain-containing protein [Thermoanaerobaculia bacterium]|nr:SIS domain-containing protein [Thermoanaerobaculia bacterium]
MTDAIRTYFEASAGVLRNTGERCGDAIARAAGVLIASYRKGGKLLLCGNGGSAADCQHMATELVSRFAPDLDRAPLAAIALTTDTSFLTAFANDCGYDGIFERQIRAHGRAGDVLLAISTSGNSRNVLAGVRAAKELGLHVIALTGATGSLSTMADVSISVPSTDTQHIQESHLAIEHLLCAMVENALFREGGQQP